MELAGQRRPKEIEGLKLDCTEEEKQYSAL